MRRGDDGDHRHVQLGQPGQRRDLAGMVHPDLDHREIGGDRHPRQRQRHAPVVVVAGLCRMGVALPRQDRAQHLLGRGLADRPGDAHHFRLGPRPGEGAQSLQRLQNVRHDQSGASGDTPSGIWLTSAAAAPFASACRHELMPVPHILQRDEQIARRQRPRVDGNAIGFPRARDLPARRLRRIGGGPEHQITPSSAATATEACSTSSKG
jgi:hypothetical protein